MKVKSLIVGTLVVLTTACASQPDKLKASHVSSLKYSAYTCEQLTSEKNLVEKKRNDLHEELGNVATLDAVQFTAGMFLVWPALLFLEFGEAEGAEEYSTLKGEYEALDSEITRKQCAPTN